jgi:hypothetical protein
MQKELLNAKHFHFISSYRGTHDYGVHLPIGSHHRLSVRAHRDTRDDDCTLSPEDYEREINGKLGYVSCLSREVLTDEMVAAFNRACFLKRESEVSTILANPKRYGEYTETPYKVVVGARYDRDTKSWVPLNDFETIRLMAGIPSSKCVFARSEARADLALVA